ncbi:MAG: hypothetical protein EZS28_024708 [Streblomastix strix]|uniref:Uncharacterized protein n=1 Tax=Streblomastix strix TaxID=222440 RepID=A0A5J4VBM0_9EUKA|nr:MAG: hypothetical protein EZS28_024708 [Streblomastix strix]
MTSESSIRQALLGACVANSDPFFLQKNCMDTDMIDVIELTPQNMQFITLMIKLNETMALNLNSKNIQLTNVTYGEDMIFLPEFDEINDSRHSKNTIFFIAQRPTYLFKTARILTHVICLGINIGESDLKQLVKEI